MPFVCRAASPTARQPSGVTLRPPPKSLSPRDHAGLAIHRDSTDTHTARTVSRLLLPTDLTSQRTTERRLPTMRRSIELTAEAPFGSCTSRPPQSSHFNRRVSFLSAPWSSWKSMRCSTRQLVVSPMTPPVISSLDAYMRCWSSSRSERVRPLYPNSARRHRQSAGLGLRVLRCHHGCDQRV